MRTWPFGQRPWDGIWMGFLVINQSSLGDVEHLGFLHQSYPTELSNRINGWIYTLVPPPLAKLRTVQWSPGAIQRLGIGQIRKDPAGGLSDVHDDICRLDNN